MSEPIGLAVAIIVGFNSLVLFIVGLVFWEIRRLRDWRHMVSNKLSVMNVQIREIENHLGIKLPAREA